MQETLCVYFCFGSCHMQTSLSSISHKLNTCVSIILHFHARIHTQPHTALSASPIVIKSPLNPTNQKGVCCVYRSPNKTQFSARRTVSLRHHCTAHPADISTVPSRSGFHNPPPPPLYSVPSHEADERRCQGCI